MTYLRTVTVDTDNATGDAFSRLRVSSPEYVFDASFEYDLQPLLFEQITAESGATIAHETTERSALLTFASTPTGGRSEVRTFEHFRYQPGRSQLVFCTFNLLGGVANVTKYVGYSDGSNGVELQLVGTQPRLALLSDTSKGDEFVNQADWNVDPLDGTGTSGLTLDLATTHILVVDFQWLGVGRIRVGFDLGGVIVVAHEFVHANVQTVAYMQSANLPIRAGMTSTATVSTTMRFICCSVISEGGQQDVLGYEQSLAVSGTAGNGAPEHIVSLRPKTTFNSITNRSKFVLESVDILVTGNVSIAWSLVLGQAITGDSYGDVSAAYSGMQASTAGTLSGSPALVIASGHVAASANAKSSVTRGLSARYPITLNAAGAVRANGTLTLLATSTGAASAIRAALSWREIR
jgi:hypothetical protein